MNIVISKLIKDFDIKIKDENVKKLLSAHITQMLYNITSLCAITALSKHKKSITKEDIDELHKYIKDSKKMKGGTSMPSDFFGYSRAGTTYSESNDVSGSVRVSNINWNSGVARPAQGPPLPMIGGGAKYIEYAKNSKEIKDLIKLIIKSQYIVKLSKTNSIYLYNIIDINLNRLGSQLKDKSVSSNMFKKLIKNKTLRIFN